MKIRGSHDNVSVLTNANDSLYEHFRHSLNNLFYISQAGSQNLHNFFIIYSNSEYLENGKLPLAHFF